jgi:hypothetical protein
MQVPQDIADTIAEFGCIIPNNSIQAETALKRS